MANQRSRSARRGAGSDGHSPLRAGGGEGRAAPGVAPLLSINGRKHSRSAIPVRPDFDGTHQVPHEKLGRQLGAPDKIGIEQGPCVLRQFSLEFHCVSRGGVIHVMARAPFGGLGLRPPSHGPVLLVSLRSRPQHSRTTPVGYKRGPPSGVAAFTSSLLKLKPGFVR